MTATAHTVTPTHDRDHYEHAVCACGWTTSAGDAADTHRRLRDAADFHLQAPGVHTDDHLLVTLAQSVALVHAFDAAGDEVRSAREEAGNTTRLAAEAERRGLDVTAPYAFAAAVEGNLARTVHHLTR